MGWVMGDKMVNQWHRGTGKRRHRPMTCWEGYIADRGAVSHSRGNREWRIMLLRGRRDVLVK